jgi:GntR family transcriptional regulator
VEEIPALMETLYFHAGIFKDIDTIDSKYRSLSEVVRDLYYMKPSGGRQNFRIGYLSKTQAGLLEIPIQTPVLLVNRYLNFPQAENAVYSEMFCRTDRFVFSQELEAIRHV